MSEKQHILDQTLPLSMNFALLKGEALAFIQEYGGSNWTNLNPSDPGVIILDQICYALTELGYCTNFPMRDLLTNKQGQLTTRNRFYLPSEIMTTTPVTSEDYRKVVIASSSYIDNAIVEIVPGEHPGISQKVQVYYKLSRTAPRSNYAYQIQMNLQQFRNLANWINRPQPLNKKKIQLKGQLVLREMVEVNDFIEKLETLSDQAVFPKVEFLSFSEAFEQAGSMEAVFDGPLLKQGFILDENLKSKQNQFTNTQMAHLLYQLPEVKGVTQLEFIEGDDSTSKVSTLKEEILTFDWLDSLKTGMLTLVVNGNDLPINSDQNRRTKGQKQRKPPITKSIDDSTVPTGAYRDVNTYYSIQNTFPASFGVGKQGVKSHDLDPAVKQLKGYLTLVDQVLANQFSQLANLGDLFSFENSWTADPSDLEAYMSKMNRLETLESQSEYPVPYACFSPTYYYQSLYDVPNIKPLLKDHHVFDFSDEIQSEEMREENSWNRYKNDPYNAYIKGLMDLMVHPSVDWQRRSKILDHLLARHGESPLLIDQYITGSTYTGVPLQDRVIFKSLYLQNLGLLSYHQPKAYDFASADRMADVPTEWSIDLLKPFYGNFKKDFIFNSHKVSELELLHPSDFTNFSAIELKASLLLGLKPLIADFIKENYQSQPTEARQAFWFIEQRKGLLMIETGLLEEHFKSETREKMPNEEPVWDTQLLFILPAAVKYLETNDFMTRMKAVLNDALPVQQTYEILLLDQEELARIIPLYVAWHNDLIQTKSLLKNIESVPTSAPLRASLLNLIATDD